MTAPLTAADVVAQLRAGATTSNWRMDFLLAQQGAEDLLARYAAQCAADANAEAAHLRLERDLAIEAAEHWKAAAETVLEKLKQAMVLVDSEQALRAELEQRLASCEAERDALARSVLAKSGGGQA